MAAMIVLGAFVHSGNHFRTARRNNEAFTLLDWFIVGITSVFAGCAFALLATLLSENPIHWVLSGCVGSYLGQTGLAALSTKWVGGMTHNSSNSGNDEQK